MKPLVNPIEEAERYLQNAKQILSEKAGKDGNYYSDPKYVKMAGHTAWVGVLHALDATFQVRKDKRTRVHIDDYLLAVGKVDKKFPSILHNAYETLHLVLGYDGNLNYKVVQGGLIAAKDVIDRTAKHYHKQ
ncbi:MAG: DUF5618 family protein [Candidatus Symbiothrix sp.]|jgi:hypothetical protein|nr:DUF5618 family protein [Candidatus Symbiothrix sp.]